MDDHRVTHCGKQIMLDGQHLADAVSPEAAEVIAIALSMAGDEADITFADVCKVEEFLR